MSALAAIPGTERAARAVALALLAVLAAACAERPGRAAAGSRKSELVVTRGAIEDIVLMTGHLDAAESAVLVTPRTQNWTATVRWMEEDGARVTAGQKVLEFDNSALVSQLEEKRLAALQAENALVRQEAEDAIVTAEREFAVEQHRITHDKARLEAEVAADLLTARDYQERQLALQRAEVALEQARDALAAHLAAAALTIRIKRIELDTARRDIQSVEAELASLVLAAPRDGILIVAEHWREGRKIKIGDTLWPSMPVVKLPDLSVMNVIASLSDVDDGRIAAGMKATCVLDAYPDIEFPGTVKEISPVAKEPSRDSLIRAFQVTIALDETDAERMRPGMSVKVIVHARNIDEGLLAPRAGIDLEAAPPRVWIEGGGEAEVEIDFCTAQMCLLKSGPEPGIRLRSQPGIAL
jgi:HlyD family secretion protein